MTEADACPVLMDEFHFVHPEVEYWTSCLEDEDKHLFARALLSSSCLVKTARGELSGSVAGKSNVQATFNRSIFKQDPGVNVGNPISAFCG